MQDDKASAFAGLIFSAAMVLAISGAGVFWLWPSGITEIPIAALTLGLIGRALGAGVPAFVTLGITFMLLSPLLFD